MASATVFNARTLRALERPSPCLRISRISMSWPSWRSSSRVCLLKYPRILLRADGVATMPSQSREGLALFDVSTSTRSPTFSLYDSGTICPFTFAPTQWLPTSVCTA